MFFQLITPWTLKIIRNWYKCLLRPLLFCLRFLIYSIWSFISFNLMTNRISNLLANDCCSNFLSTKSTDFRLVEKSCLQKSYTYRQGCTVLFSLLSTFFLIQRSLRARQTLEYMTQTEPLEQTSYTSDDSRSSLWHWRFYNKCILLKAHGLIFKEKIISERETDFLWIYISIIDFIRR